MPLPPFSPPPFFSALVPLAMTLSGADLGMPAAGGHSRRPDGAHTLDVLGDDYPQLPKDKPHYLKTSHAINPHHMVSPMVIRERKPINIKRASRTLLVSNSGSSG